ncbi:MULTISPECIES: LpxI family protein [Dethiosulfovibrio]|uniref:UDP-2,3-diacylglucosamine diphosphatase LpxI n=2 Tax=Dethiosulfovibrio TaxID=47054 RepID=A0ABS9EVX1_9BACT|nr:MULTISPECIES: UDP-2,3-diacylglucosamine diphosphatase LpxI [Dethiosulfovibrio]MCF4113949.1 UDP-2,3-diacylglucosamine diphosphatase LpxI [Dethiosulfovibrio russensis]MCF4143945.1 UDP-2,3-diacylglucosamine diphosphatase LpxI [Dethiosulfovibrio acidaminovorans]
MRGSSKKGKMALVAGEGDLPLVILKNLVASGETPVVYAIRPDWQDIEAYGLSVIPVKEINLVKIFGSLVFRRIKRLLLAGYVSKTVIYDDSADSEIKGIVAGLDDRNDHALLGAVIDRVEKLGISVLGYDSILPDMIASEGHIAGPEPSASDLADVDYGRAVLGRLLPLSFGQSLVVCRRSVVAVEAMEGTDETITRAGGISGAGVLVKGMRADQDRRYDIPVVGTKTLESMAESGLSCLAVESGNVLIMDREKLSEAASRHGISVIGMASCPSS